MGLGVNELLLPEDYFEKYMDATRPPDGQEEDAHEMKVDRVAEEKSRGEIKKSAKPEGGTSLKKPEKKPETPEQVLARLVGIFHY